MTSAIMRVAGIGDVRTMLDWAEAEAWNPGLDDAEAFLAADPGGFFVAEIDGVPVASISVVNHSEDVAFLGLYICRSGFRGQGIGHGLWKHALGHAGSRTISLDGVPAQEGNYRKSGFVRSGATVRFEGRIPASESPDIRDLTDDDMPQVLRLDAEATGYSRKNFMAAWLTPTENRKAVVLSQGPNLAGFAVIRRCRTGTKIGPVTAPDAEAGLALMQSAVARLPSDGQIVDVPAGTSRMVTLLERHGFNETFATARMYRGREVRPSDALMAIATMELG